MCQVHYYPSETGAVAIKPDSLSWEQAVAIPFGANTALYLLRDLGNIQAGQDLLIIGASGAIGSAGVQLAKHFGARVTGVCSGANAELVKALGADSVIDYTREDFTESGTAHDVIVVGATSFDRCQSSLKPNGVFPENIMELSGIGRMFWTRPPRPASAKRRRPARSPTPRDDFSQHDGGSVP